MQQLPALLPPGDVQCAPHPQLPMAILLQGSGPHHIDPQAAGGEQAHNVAQRDGEMSAMPAHAACLSLKQQEVGRQATRHSARVGALCVCARGEGQEGGFCTASA